MICKIDRSGFVGYSPVFNMQRVFNDPIRNGDIEISGKTLFAIPAFIGEYHPISLRENLRFPVFLIKPRETAMQATNVIIFGKLIFLVIDLKPAIGDPVGITTTNTSDIKMTGIDITLHAFKTQHHIRRRSVPAGHKDTRDCGAVIDHRNLYTRRLRDRILINGSSFEFAKRLYCYIDRHQIKRLMIFSRYSCLPLVIAGSPFSMA